MAKSTATGASEFRVALNPRNAEATSWYDPTTGVNLFLNAPESHDLSRFEASQLTAIKRGIKAGLLIVSRGELPEGLTVKEINQFAAPRSRWGEEHKDVQEQALDNWNKLLTAQA